MRFDVVLGHLILRLIWWYLPHNDIGTWLSRKSFYLFHVMGKITLEISGHWIGISVRERNWNNSRAPNLVFETYEGLCTKRVQRICISWHVHAKAPGWRRKHSLSAGFAFSQYHGVTMSGLLTARNCGIVFQFSWQCLNQQSDLTNTWI
jgi:hypothetical protein